MNYERCSTRLNMPRSIACGGDNHDVLSRHNSMRCIKPVDAAMHTCHVHGVDIELVYTNHTIRGWILSFVYTCTLSKDGLATPSVDELCSEARPHSRASAYKMEEFCIHIYICMHVPSNTCTDLDKENKGRNPTALALRRVRKVSSPH